MVSGAVFEFSAAKVHLTLGSAFSHPRDIIAVVAAALAYFVTNTILLSVVIALAQDKPILAMLRQESTYQVVGSIGMFGLAPIAIVTAGRSIWLLPVLLIPLAIAYQSTVVTIEKEHQALHDSLTGLPNREMFRLRAMDAIRRGDPRSGSWTALMLIDLNRFKEINDTLGHGTGDLVLRELGPRLLGAIGDDCTVARLGGDEFGMILPGLDDPLEAERSALKVLEAIRQPMVMHGLDLEVGASIGIAMQGRDGEDADTLIQRADIAMYSAKESGSGHAVYTSMLDQTSPMQLGLVSQLRQAIETSGLAVWVRACSAGRWLVWSGPPGIR